MSRHPSPRFRDALALVRRTYADAPLPVRLHAVGRFLTCPFVRVLSHLPAGARLLDPRVRFVAGYADAVGGEFDAVSIFDVICRVPIPAWDGILGAAFDRLAPGGVLLLKEIDPAHRLKGGWNRTQEHIADLLGMTLGDAFSYETREQIRDRLTALGFASFEAVELGTGYPHAHILYKARKPG